MARFGSRMAERLIGRAGARCSHPDGQPFPCTTSTRPAVDQPGLKIEFVVSDRLGDMIEDWLELALRLGEITNSCRSHASCLHRPRRRARFGGVDLCRGAQGFRASRGFLANVVCAAHRAARAGYDIAFLSVRWRC
jgi:hypothetical protein